MKKFDWDKFKTEKIAVHCKTEEEAKDFCKKMHEQGMKWKFGVSYIEKQYYDVYQEKMCYYADSEYSDLDYAKEKGYIVLEWSDYMQKEFTKADLKDGMIVKYRNGEMFLKFDGKLINNDGFEELNTFDNNLKDVGFSSDYDIMKIYKLNLTKVYCLKDIFNIENLELIWQRTKTKCMTAEEMRQKLGELTGEEIEIEPSREEMVGACYVHCENSSCVRNCILINSGNCVFRKYPDEQLKEAYKKVIANGK